MPVAVITGGNRGLGLQQSRRFLGAGYEVYVVARNEGETAELGKSAHLCSH